MTKELKKAIETVKAYLDMDSDINSEYLNAQRTIIQALEQQPCEDCISRQKALDCFEQTNTRQGAKYAIETLPSVTPQRPKGKWIEVEVHNCHATLKCSVCDRVIEPTFTFGEYSYEDIKTFYPYCHCGAEMSGDAEMSGGGEE